MLELIGLREDLVARTCDRLLERREGADLSAAAAVYPSKRFGFFLRRELASRFEGSFFPPAMFSIEGFFEALFKLNFPGFRILNDLETDQALFESARAVFPKGIYGFRANAGFVAFLPWAQKLRTALEEILTEGERIEGISFAEYEAFTGLGDYHKDYKEFIRKIPDLLADLRRRLESRRQATVGTVHRWTAERAEKGDLAVPPARHWIFSGFNAVNACERKLLRFFLNRSETALILRSDPAGLQDPFSPFHLQTETLKALRLAPPSEFTGPGAWAGLDRKVTLYPCDGVESEAFQAYRILKEACRGRTDEDLRKVAVLLPASPTLLPMVQGAVSRFDQETDPVPFNITLGYPMERTPMMQLVDSILTVYENGGDGRIAADDYLRLIRHPYVKISGGGGDLEPLKRGIHRLENIITAGNLTRFTLEDLADAAIDPEGLAVASEIRGMHERFIPRGIADMTGLLAFLRRALESVGRESNLAAYLFLNEYAAAALGALAELEEFVAGHGSDFGDGDPAGMAALVRSHFRGRTIQFEGTPLRGVQVMGPLEFRGLSFDEVVVLDALEGVLPGTSKADPLLPADIRCIFGLRDHGEKEKVFAFNFFSLLGAAGRLHVLYPRRGEDGKESERSRFLERIVYESERAAGRPPAVAPLRFPFRISGRTLKKVGKNEAVLKQLEKIALTPSSVEAYTACPLQFYFQRVLGLKEREEVAPETDGGLIGEIAHDALKDFYGKYPSLDQLAEQSESSVFAEMDVFLVSAFRKRHFDPERGLERIRAWALREKLRAFISEDRTRSGVIIEDRERSLQASLRLSGLPRGVALKGRIDRVEREGWRRRVVDYKTGAVFDPRLRCGVELDLAALSRREEKDYFAQLEAFRKKYPGMQLLIYLILLLTEKEKDEGSFDAACVFLRGEAGNMRKDVFMTSGRGSRNFTPEERVAAMGEFQSDFEEIVRDIYLREEFLPNPSDERVCGFCPFRLPCGNL